MTRPLRAPGLALLALLALACDDDDRSARNNGIARPDAGGADAGAADSGFLPGAGCGAAPVAVPLPEHAAPRVGTVGLVLASDRRDDPTGRPKDGLTAGVVGSFRDNTGTVYTPARVETYGGVCERIISEATRQPRGRPVEAGALTIDGTTQGRTVVPRRDGGYFLTSMPLLDETTRDLVFAAEGSADFDPFRIEVNDVPHELDLRAPLLGTAALGSPPFVVRWVPAGADVAVIGFTLTGTSLVAEITCRVRDTGCFELPEDAKAHLLSTSNETFELSVLLGRQVHRETPEQAVQIDVLVGTQLTLDRGP